MDDPRLAGRMRCGGGFEMRSAIPVAVWRPPRLASRTCGWGPPGCESEHSGPTAIEMASDLRIERPFVFTCPCASGLRVELARD
eukprot:9320466-Alexandrium_andersonii.AAC.1